MAWDYPIDVTAAQKIPNDNFGAYSLSYQQNGGSPRSFLTSDYAPNGAPCGTPPTVRVPNLWQASVPTMPPRPRSWPCGYRYGVGRWNRTRPDQALHRGKSLAIAARLQVRVYDHALRQRYDLGG